MSGMAAYTPGMEITGGSLGQGLAIAVGMCLGLKRKSSASFVYILFSDGELDEGSVWEAAMSAAQLQARQPDRHRRRQQHAGRRPVQGRARTSSRWRRSSRRSAGSSQRVDGNDIDAVVAAFDAARDTRPSRSRASSSATRGWARACPSWRRARATISCASSRMNGPLALDACWTTGGPHEARQVHAAGCRRRRASG